MPETSQINSSSNMGFEWDVNPWQERTSRNDITIIAKRKDLSCIYRWNGIVEYYSDSGNFNYNKSSRQTGHNIGLCHKLCHSLMCYVAFS